MNNVENSFWMKQLVSKFTSRVEANSRLVLPACLHKQLGNEVVVTNSLDYGYLCIYTPERFSDIEKQLGSLNALNANVRKLRRVVIGESERLTINSKHEITISEELLGRVEAVVGDVLCLFGYDDKVEVCTKSFYDTSDNDVSSIDDMSSLYYISSL